MADEKRHAKNMYNPPISQEGAGCVTYGFLKAPFGRFLREQRTLIELSNSGETGREKGI
jgi:hypothetical protein